MWQLQESTQNMENILANQYNQQKIVQLVPVIGSNQCITVNEVNDV